MRLGDLAGAEEALRQAHALGRSPQPALALIRLAQGKVGAALSAIGAVVAERSPDPWVRARVLPAHVEIAVAAGEVGPARGAAEELSGIAETFASPALHATAHDAWGRVLLAERDPEAAARELREGIRHWREVNAPYEIARDRTLLGSALADLGLAEDARLELEAALREFEALGAARDSARLAELVRGADQRNAAPVQIRRTFLFTDIVSSTNLAEAMGDEAWEHLLRWHDDTLRALISEHGGEVVNGTGDGFFAAFESPADAIRSSVAIQAALAEHRRTQGFAPGVRIGLHVADANQRSGDYSGKGVHVAARIAALAGAGEIFASAETVAEDRPCPVSEPRSVSLKGVADDVSIVSIVWS
ncbi:MAG: adenylate/guanylate cyclase domain-containing protein [Actinomycetota bacterium]